MKRKKVWEGLHWLGVLDGPSRSGREKERENARASARVRGGGAAMFEGEEYGSRRDGDGDGGRDERGVEVGRRVVGVRHW